MVSVTAVVFRDLIRRLTSEHLKFSKISGTRLLIIASMIERAIVTFTARPDFRIPRNLSTISSTTSGYFAKTPTRPVPANAWCLATFAFVLVDHPDFVSLSIHLWIVPRLMFRNSLGWSSWSFLAMDEADQQSLRAALSMCTQRKG